MRCVGRLLLAGCPPADSPVAPALGRAPQKAVLRMSQRHQVGQGDPRVGQLLARQQLAVVRQHGRLGRPQHGGLGLLVQAAGAGTKAR